MNQARSKSETTGWWRSAMTAACFAAGLVSGYVSAATPAPVAVERFQVGNVPVTSVGVRDAFVVSRQLLHKTDAHGFADKTVIDQVQDAGTYGSFDSTTELRGNNLQDHMISFQDRLKYSGSGAIKLLDGFMSHPVHAGTGKIYLRAGVDIGDMPITNGGTIDQNIGVLVQDIRSGSNNSAVVLSQSNGHTIYSSGTAPSYHRSMLFFGPGTGPVISADSSQATDVRDLSRQERNVASKLKPLIKVSRQKDGDGKIHVGVMAQDVIDTFKSEGLDANDYAIVNKEGGVLGVRYDELLAFIAATTQAKTSVATWSIMLILLVLIAALAVSHLFAVRRAKSSLAQIARLDSELAAIKAALLNR